MGVHCSDLPGDNRTDSVALDHKPWVSWLVICLGSVALTAYLLGDNLKAQWGLIDDHEIMSFLGPDRNAAPSEFMALLSGTEVGDPLRTIRFRPSYYVLRIGETILWGDSVELWYAARMAMFAASVALFWRTLAWWIGLTGAGLYLLFCLRYPFWGDIFCRLGPAETYAVAGSALFVYGIVAVLRAEFSGRKAARWQYVSYWALATTGALIALGSKENMLVLLVPVWGVFLVLARRRSAGVAAIISTATMTLYGLVVTTVVAFTVATQGHDTYLQSVSVWDRVSLLWLLKDRVFRWTWLYGRRWETAVACIGLAITAYGIARIRKIPQELTKAAISWAGLGLLYASQFIFYNGRIPSGTRYDFPGVLAVPTVGLIAVVLAGDMLRRGGVGRAVVRGLGVALFSIVMALVIWDGFDQVRTRARDNAENTRRFSEEISRIAGRMKSEPGRTLALVPHQPFDYEFCVSVAWHLKAMGITNPISIDVRSTARDGTRLEQLLRERMVTWSLEGKEGVFVPLANTASKGSCFGVGISGPTPPEYEGIGCIRP